MVETPGWYKGKDELMSDENVRRRLAELEDCDPAIRWFIDAVNEGDLGKASFAFRTLARATNVAGQMLADWKRQVDGTRVMRVATPSPASRDLT